MSMNKAEKALLDAACERAAWAPVSFECPKPMSLAGARRDNLVVGWWFNEHSQTIGSGCSSGESHSISSTTRTSSQGAGVFYSTQLEALQALRWAMTRRMMKELAAIDRQIREAEKQP